MNVWLSGWMNGWMSGWMKEWKMGDWLMKVPSCVNCTSLIQSSWPDRLRAISYYNKNIYTCICTLVQAHILYIYIHVHVYI